MDDLWEQVQAGAAPGSPVRQLWSLRDGVLVESEDDRLVVLSQWGQVTFPSPDADTRRIVERMSLGPALLPNLAPSDAARIALMAVFEQLSGSVEHTLAYRDTEQLILTVVPVAPRAPFGSRRPGPDTTVRMSRFTVLSTDGSLLHMDSPLAAHRAVLHRPAARLAGLLASPVTVARLAADSGEEPEVAAAVVGALVAAGILVTAEPPVAGEGPAVFAEDSDPDLLPWGPLDLAFHARSRSARHEGPSGMAFAIEADIPVPTMLHPGRTGPRTTLPRPEPGHVRPLVALLDAGRSPLDPDCGPSIAEIGTLLYRAARLRGVSVARSPGGVAFEVSERPYPSIGQLHEHEFYLVVGRCPGLRPGGYFYDPADHALTEVNSSPTEVAGAFEAVRHSAGLATHPPLVVTITSRIARRSWAFGPLAYASTLVHLGIIERTVQLVAHDMGLATQLVSAGVGPIVDHVLRLNSPAESSIGELIIARTRYGSEERTE